LWFPTTQVSARLDNDCCRVGFCLFRVSRLPSNRGASFLWPGARKPCGLFSGPRPWPSTPRSKTCSSAASQFFGRRCRRSVAPTMATKMFGSSGQSPLALACTRRPRLCSLRSSQGRECADCSRSEWHGPARSHLTLMGHEFFTSVNTAFARAWRHATVVPQLQSYDRSPWCGNSLHSLAWSGDHIKMQED
jgi:hypothetical protein